MSWLEAIKLANEAVEKLKNAEANAAMATVKMEMAHLAEENGRLREENLKLREAAQLRDSMVPRDNVCWRQLPSGEEEGPYCPSCWDGERKPVRLADEDSYRWTCTVCTKQRWKPDGRKRYNEVSAARPALRPVLRMRWPHW